MSGSGIAFLGHDKNIVEDSLVQDANQTQDFNNFQQEFKDGKLYLNNTMLYVEEQDLGNLGATLNLDFTQGSNSKHGNLNNASLTINVPTLNIKGASSGKIWITNTVGANTVTKGTNVVTSDGDAIELSQTIGMVDVLYWSASEVKGLVLISVVKNVA